MEIRLNIPEYNAGQGLQVTWEEGFEIESSIADSQIIISANRAGLISLAKQLLILAQAEVPNGAHFHYDEYNSLAEGSKELIVQKR
ncbi:Imm32 family immunity protein [Pedobacter sp. ASV12]|uniref:Imm32 family immunity protein n=1 Tax=Pedobacter sp. ASV12 TaxID=2795120 RepID=UPI0018ED5AE1|nr:hypothetical protein [Pedobacter sp. ASV12]